MKKKVILLSLVLMLLLTGVVSAASLWGKYKGYSVIKITVDGKAVKTDVPAFVFDNRTMVPVYLLKEAGINYSLDGNKQTVNISSKSNSTNSFDPTAATKEIMSLGGIGVTIMNVSNDTTAIVNFNQQINFDSDWPKIDKIFSKLVAFNSTFSRIEYYVNNASAGSIEIRTKDYKDYMNGVITAEQLDKRWLLYGQMFSNSNNAGSSTSGTTSTSDSTIVSKIDGEFEGFEEGKIFELQNGQIWKQISYDYKYAYKYSPKVIIYKEGIAWYMKVDGVDKTVKVERIK